MLRARSSHSYLESDFRVGFVRMDRGVYIGVVIAPRISDDNMFKHSPSDANRCATRGDLLWFYGTSEKPTQAFYPCTQQCRGNGPYEAVLGRSTRFWFTSERPFWSVISHQEVIDCQPTQQGYELLVVSSQMYALPLRHNRRQLSPPETRYATNW